MMEGVELVRSTVRPEGGDFLWNLWDSLFERYWGEIVGKRRFWMFGRRAKIEFCVNVWKRCFRWERCKEKCEIDRHWHKYWIDGFDRDCQIDWIVGLKKGRSNRTEFGRLRSVSLSVVWRQ
jgi:hypothetical protein